MIGVTKSGSSHLGHDNGTHAGQKRSAAALGGTEDGGGAHPGEQGKRRRYEGRDAAGQHLRDTHELLWDSHMLKQMSAHSECFPANTPSRVA